MNRPLLLMAILAWMPTSGTGQDTTAGAQTEMSSETVLRTKINYLLYLPKDYQQKDRHPLMLFLHGAGERGDNQLDRVKVHGPPKLIAAGMDFSFIVVSPQCKAGGWWEAAELSGLLDHVEGNYKVDKSRIYVTGLSMGGYGTWSLAFREANRFAAIAPVCGGGNALAARYTKAITVPTWAFHGAKDTVVPISNSEQMVDVLKKNDVEVKFTVYPNTGHNSWTKTYNNPQLYEWLLQHQRKPQ